MSSDKRSKACAASLPPGPRRTRGRRSNSIAARTQLAGCQGGLAGAVDGYRLFDRRFAEFLRAALSRGTRLPHAAVFGRQSGLSADGPRCGEFSRQNGQTGNHRRIDSGRPGHPRKAEISARPPAAQCDRSRHRRPGHAPAARQTRGSEVLQLQACHSAGMLLITVADDGRGIDPEVIRKAIVRKKLTAFETSQKMTDAELLEFLFLPGFTLKESVSEISGRGVGLDVVQTMVREVGGHVRISSRRAGPGNTLPAGIAAHAFGDSHAAGRNRRRALRISFGTDRPVLNLSTEQIESVEGRQHFALDREQIGLVAAHQVLDVEAVSASKTKYLRDRPG